VPTLRSRPLLLALTALALLALPALAARPRSPVELTIKDDQGAPVDGATVTFTVKTGEPFTVEGRSDRRGRFATRLPDFTRIYQLKVEKTGYMIFEQAVDFASQGLEADSTAQLTVTLPVDHGPSAEALYNEGVHAIQTNDLADAEAKMRAATQLKPDFARAWSVLGMIAADAKRWTDALAAAERALALESGDINSLRTRFLALGGLGRTDDASAALDALAAADPSPDTARLLFNAGAAAWTAENGELAARRFEQALVADPKLYQAHAGLAEVKIGKQNLAGAHAELELALGIAPDNIKLWRRQLEVVRALGRGDEAAAVEKKLAELGAAP
jgi:tetratricopeptide (TPR) repeat protein